MSMSNLSQKPSRMSSMSCRSLWNGFTVIMASLIWRHQTMKSHWRTMRKSRIMGRESYRTGKSWLMRESKKNRSVVGVHPIVNYNDAYSAMDKYPDSVHSRGNDTLFSPACMVEAEKRNCKVSLMRPRWKMHFLSCGIISHSFKR